MEDPALSREELTDIQGQLHALKVITNMPREIDKQLETILAQEEVQRELKEQNQNARASVR